MSKAISIPCPVGGDRRDKCKGAVTELAGSGYQCDKDKAHTWLGNGQPRYKVILVGNVEVVSDANQG